MRSVIALATVLATALPASGEGPDWKATMAGVDGLVVYCKSSTRQEYARTICDALADRVVERAAAAGLQAASTGLVHSGPAARDGEASEPVRSVDGVSAPLFVGVHLRGTDDGNPAIYVGVRILAPGRGGPPGDILISEEDVVANGPRKRLPKALIAHMTGKTDALMDAMLAAR